MLSRLLGKVLVMLALFVVALFVGIVSWFIYGAAIMFLFGLLHSHVFPSVPALGWWNSFLLGILWTILKSAPAKAETKKD